MGFKRFYVDDVSLLMIWHMCRECHRRIRGARGEFPGPRFPPAVLFQGEQRHQEGLMKTRKMFSAIAGSIAILCASSALAFNQPPMNLGLTDILDGALPGP